MNKFYETLESFGRQLAARLLLACALAVVGCVITLAMPVFFIACIVCALFGWIERFPKIRLHRLWED